MSQNVLIRPAIEADLSILEDLPFSAGLKSKHAERLDRQAQDQAVYVMAEFGGVIVGHLLLKWDCPSAPELRAVAPPCAEVEDFVVQPDLRSQGIGSRMLTFADDLCRARGVSHIGLGVGLENPSARTIYEHRGYILVPDSRHLVTWPQLDAEGNPETGSEWCVYLVKAVV
jgi:GNAT superfamily N-acetyltransferase